jgi:hypothetical protein
VADQALFPKVTVLCFWAPSCRHVESGTAPAKVQAAMQAHYGRDHAGDLAALGYGPGVPSRPAAWSLEAATAGRSAHLCDGCRQCQLGYHCSGCQARRRDRACTPGPARRG